MKRVLVSLLSGVFIFSVAFSATKGSVKAPKLQKLEKSRMMESEATIVARDASYWSKPYNYSNRNGVVNTLVDSSANGYGMVSSVTRPIDVSVQGKWALAFRQFVTENTTHGQMGTAVSNNGEQWIIYYNLNNCVGWEGQGGCQSGRYPSAIATHDYPYIIWNEYSAGVAGWPADCSNYGGRPYYSYDEFLILFHLDILLLRTHTVLHFRHSFRSLF